MIDQNNLIICSAIDGEIDWLKKTNPDLGYLETGIGNIRASLAITRALEQNPQIKTVILIGSAGYYPPASFQIGQIIHSTKFYNLDWGVLNGFSKQIESIPNHYSFDSVPFIKKFMDEEGIVEGVVNSFDSISVQRYDGFKASSLDFENMEGFGAALACKDKTVNLQAILILTNECGPEGRVEWKKNWRECSLKLQKFVDMFLRKNML